MEEEKERWGEREKVEVVYGKGKRGNQVTQSWPGRAFPQSNRPRACKRETMSSRGLPSYLDCAPPTTLALSSHTITAKYTDTLSCTPCLTRYLGIPYSFDTTRPHSEAISRQPSHQSLCETPGSSPYSCDPLGEGITCESERSTVPAKDWSSPTLRYNRAKSTQSCLDEQLFVCCAKLSGDCGGGACCYLRSTVYLTLFLMALFPETLNACSRDAFCLNTQSLTRDIPEVNPNRDVQVT